MKKFTRAIDNLKYEYIPIILTTTIIIIIASFNYEIHITINNFKKKSVTNLLKYFKTRILASYDKSSIINKLN